ncbi:glyoxalase family protein [Stemphylium lycopersici]|uniref:Glyoxalase family protein n=1 Tax=Stemphylium lycopersici TaxID=183478 RepID=A0A364MZM0_STELY|nr:glyoxalase family protein [Stemphylium lycopersici]RAR07310.1 glyoxalase family protein [Stemphylium lycopersici]RAR07650.1 glyoxalase family protein [Stemphylium lycopersici]
MPVAHIGLTVSHLPTSTSFFLSALQPLGYRYIGETGHQIGLGIYNADFFLCQETPGVKAGAAHIAFTAPSTTAVRNFYTAALTAGGRPNGSPATRDAQTGHFNAAVLDFDGNSIEAVYKNGPDMAEDGTVYKHSRVITWRRTVTTSYRESSSTHTYTSTSRAAPSAAPPQAEAAVPKPPSVARSISADNVVPAPEATKTNSEEGAGKQLFGALLGAAAGAAVAYAFVRSERDSAKKEAEFNAFLDAKNAVKNAAGLFAQTPSQPEPPQQTPQPAPPAPPVQPAEPTPPPAQPTPQAIAPPPEPPQSVHRNNDDDDARSTYSRASQIPKTTVPRQIEAAPADYYAPSQFSAPSALAQARALEYSKPRAIEYAEPQAIEYAPAHSRAPSAAPSRLTLAHRSSTSPELLMLEQSRSTVSAGKYDNMEENLKPPRPSKSRSVVSKAHSAAPSTLVSSFVADYDDMKSSAGSERSHRSSRSKAKSSHSKHTSSRKERVPSPPPPPPPPAPPAKKVPPKVPSKAASLVSSIFNRDKNRPKDDDDDDFIDDLDIEELTEDDLDTVVPSDSISQIGEDGPRRRRRTHRTKSSKNDDGETSVSHRSKKHSDDAESSISKSSKRSHRSRSHRTADSADDEDSSRTHHRSSRSSKTKPSIIASEPSEASTVRPVTKSSSSSSSPSSSSFSKSSRKDSLTQGQYDHLFDEVQYGTGNVHTSRNVGPTPSMVSAARKNPIRGMINFNHAQKLRNFEGSQAGVPTDRYD